MTRASAILLLSAVIAFAADAPKPAILSAEQAVVCFREARETDLKTSLTEQNRKYVASVSSAGYLTVRLMQPRDYKPPYRGADIQDEAQWRILGTLAAAAESKTGTWRLSYDTGIVGGLVVYLDAITGKVLYIHSVPEG